MIILNLTLIQLNQNGWKSIKRKDMIDRKIPIPTQKKEPGTQSKNAISNLIIIIKVKTATG